MNRFRSNFILTERCNIRYDKVQEICAIELNIWFHNFSVSLLT